MSEEKAKDTDQKQYFQKRANSLGVNNQIELIILRINIIFKFYPRMLIVKAYYFNDGWLHSIKIICFFSSLLLRILRKKIPLMQIDFDTFSNFVYY